MKTHYAPLDGLKVAVLLLLYIKSVPHIPPLVHTIALIMDWVWVDLFIVISIFLGTVSLIEEYESSGKISILRYYLRRALRLLPLYYFYLAAVLFFTNFDWKEMHAYVRLISYVLLCSNWTDAFFKPSGNSYLNILWFVPYLVQQHLLLPWIYLGSRKLRLQTGMAWALVITAVAICARYLLAEQGVSRLFIPMIPFLKPEAFIIGFGTAIALKYPYYLPALFKSKGMLALVMLAGFAGLWTLNNPLQVFEVRRFVWLYLVCSLLWGATLFYLLYFRSTARNFFGWVQFKHPAQLIYGLYIYRWCSIMLITKMLPGVSYWLTLILSWGLAYITSYVSYRIIEEWFLKFKKR